MRLLEALGGECAGTVSLIHENSDGADVEDRYVEGYEEIPQDALAKNDPRVGAAPSARTSRSGRGCPSPALKRRFLCEGWKGDGTARWAGLRRATFSNRPL